MAIRHLLRRKKKAPDAMTQEVSAWPITSAALAGALGAGVLAVISLGMGAWRKKVQ